MSKDLMLDVGAANELKMSFRRNGYTEADVKKLGEGDFLASVLKVLRGQCEIKDAEHVIDCDTNPFVPKGWKVEEHQKQGMVKWSKFLITLFLAEGQEDGKSIVGNELRKLLKGVRVMNANVLDFLLKHPGLIPDEWKGKAVFFWGTVYRYSDGDLYVRYLYWVDATWRWSGHWLDRDWHVGYPAAVHAS